MIKDGCFRGVRVCAPLVLLAAVLLSGCVSLERTQSRAVDAPWVWEGKGHRVTLLMEPEVPAAGKMVQAAIRVEGSPSLEAAASKLPSVAALPRDNARSEGGPAQSARPVEGADVSCRIYMPEEPGHIHIVGPHTHTGTAPGLYPMKPMAFEMGGVWVLDAKIRLPEGQTLNARFRINVEGPPWPPSHASSG